MTYFFIKTQNLFASSDSKEVLLFYS